MGPKPFPQLPKNCGDFSSVRSFYEVVWACIGLDRLADAEAAGGVGFGALYPTYLRGLAYVALKKAAAAAAEFQKIVDHRGVVLEDSIGAHARLQLARNHAVPSATRGHFRSAGITRRAGGDGARYPHRRTLLSVLRPRPIVRAAWTELVERASSFWSRSRLPACRRAL